MSLEAPRDPSVLDLFRMLGAKNGLECTMFRETLSPAVSAVSLIPEVLKHASIGERGGGVYLW
jgi:hypothetical protein